MPYSTVPKWNEQLRPSTNLPIFRTFGIGKSDWKKRESKRRYLERSFWKGRDQRNHLRAEKRCRQVHGLFVGRAIRRHAQPFHFNVQRNFLPFAHRDKEEQNPRRSLIDPTEVVGQYVEPEDWNALIKDPDVLLVDTRNDYEVELGTFNGAVDPDNQNFSQWPISSRNPWKNPKRKNCHVLHRGYQVREHLPTFCKTDSKKSPSAEYSPLPRKIPPRKANGKANALSFITKSRSLTDLRTERPSFASDADGPLTNEDLSSPDYEEGVSCPKCNGELSERVEKACASASPGRTRPQAPRNHIGLQSQAPASLKSSSRLIMRPSSFILIKTQ